MRDSFRDWAEPAMRRMAELLVDHLMRPLYEDLNQDPAIRSRLNPAFPYPRTIRVGALKNGLVLEFIGPEHEADESLPISLEHSPKSSVLSFLGIDQSAIDIPYFLSTPLAIDNLNCYVGDSIDRLNELNYDYSSSADYSLINGLPDFEPERGEYKCFSNLSMFWTDLQGQLRVRHVDFLEIHGLVEVADTLGYPFHTKESMHALRRRILDLEVPQFDIRLHRTLNDFIELMHSDGVNEPELTRFLADNPAIIGLALGYRDLNPETELVWQDGSALPNLKPDFLPERPDGFCDILEFKLDRLRSSPTVGIQQRQRPSAEVAAALAQIETYRDYCQQRVNREWALREKGLRLQAEPRHTLIIGLRSQYPPEERQRVQQFRNTSILTYDEFLDMARHQLYRAH